MHEEEKLIQLSGTKPILLKLGRNSRHVIIMKIEIGKTYHNKTLKFLLPSLKLLGTDFRQNLILFIL
jgi:hypothetical protein